LGKNQRVSILFLNQQPEKEGKMAKRLNQEPRSEETGATRLLETNTKPRPSWELEFLPQDL
jgi:hypothetical protein